MALAAVAVLAVGGVAAGVAVLGSGRNQDHPARSKPAPSVAANREHAAAWIANQVSPATVVSCDPVTCVMIESHGFPASRIGILARGR